MKGFSLSKFPLSPHHRGERAGVRGSNSKTPTLRIYKNHLSLLKKK
jgi:hypothetical protein